MDQPTPPSPHITLAETSSIPPIVQAVRRAFEDAMTGKGAMDDRVYYVPGFCGKKHRLFVNNLVRSIDNPRYLEIGIFRGATLCAAISDNKVKVTGVDNWSEYGGKANEFYTNLAAIKGPDSSVTILEQDFRSIHFDHIGKFNIYFYDGPHQEKDQYDGVRMALPALDDHAILIVDDWNWQRVRSGTLNALRDAGVRTDFTLELRTSFDDQIPSTFFGGGSDWHNGMFAAVVSKGG
jgi:hypothetical protein